MARSIIPDLKADCERLINQYVELNTTSFAKFVTVWKLTQFDLIYAGQGENEIDYFIFHIIHVAKGFCDESKPTLQRVAGLYLLYLLYYTEPLKERKSIRVIPDEFISLRNFAEEFKNENKEVSYAFYKLLVDSAFDFVITPLPYDETLIHLKEDLKSFSGIVYEKDSRTAIMDSVFQGTGFNRSEWSKLVNDYNAVKKRINSSTSLNLNLTKDLNMDIF